MDPHSQSTDPQRLDLGEDVEEFTLAVQDLGRQTWSCSPSVACCRRSSVSP